ncbi:MAG: hypothetical protein ACE365_03450 [Gammaproteobacteria bacterium]
MLGRNLVSEEKQNQSSPVENQSSAKDEMKTVSQDTSQNSTENTRSRSCESGCDHCGGVNAFGVVTGERSSHNHVESSSKPRSYSNDTSMGSVGY